MKTNHDHITLINTSGRGNKLVKRTATGTDKERGTLITQAWAHTVHVPDITAMAALLKQIGNDSKAVICLGYIPGTEPAPGETQGNPYRMASKAWIAERSKTAQADINGWHDINGERVIARLKENMLPSSWAYFDVDKTAGMPDRLFGLDAAQFIECMGEMITNFDKVAKVELPSTSGRVLIDGVAMEASGFHIYFQIQDPYDLGRFGAVLLQRSFLHGYGFMRTWGEAVRQWSIFDPSVFSHERLVYDGKPSIEGAGMEVGPPVVTYTPGGRLDTSTVKDLNPVEEDEVYSLTGCRVKKEARKRLRMTANGPKQIRVFEAITVDDQQLQPDTKVTVQIDGEHHTITVLEYWESAHKKLRCQVVFRDSTSWNGILNRHDGVWTAPFLFDNGARVKYVLSQEHVETHRVGVWIKHLERMDDYMKHPFLR